MGDETMKSPTQDATKRRKDEKGRLTLEQLEPRVMLDAAPWDEGQVVHLDFDGATLIIDVSGWRLRVLLPPL